MILEKKPKVSIIMGIYNCESTLKESIESIINQTYTNWELIMCDDCSKDNTYNLAKEYAAKYPNKIKLLKNEKNITLGPTLNRCIELVQGKYIARQDGDDISTPDRLEKQIEFLEKNNQFDLVSTAMSIFDENGEYGVRKLKSEPQGKDLMKGSVFAHATVVIKSDSMRYLNGYSNEMKKKQVEDYDLWFRFFENGYKGYCLDDVLYKVREDRNAYKRKSIKRRFNEIGVMIEGCKRLKLSPINYVRIIKPVIAAIVPQEILMKYHRNKFKLKK